MKRVYSIYNGWYKDDDLPFLAELGIKIIPGPHDWEFTIRRPGLTMSEEHGYGVDPEEWEWRLNHDKPYVIKRINIPEGPVYDAIHERYSGNKAYPKYTEDKDYEYSREEILESEYCVLRRIPYKGYPQPEYGDWEGIVYDKTRMCPECGQEKFQIGDFRISEKCSKPLWTFFAWVCDVLFVTPELYKDVFEPLGIGCRTVRKRSGKVFEGVLQLDIPAIDENLDLSLQDRWGSTCTTCGKKRTLGIGEYPFAPLQEHPLPHIYLSKEYFGAGGLSLRDIFISTELAMKLVGMKALKLNSLIPCRRDLVEYLKTIEY